MSAVTVADSVWGTLACPSEKFPELFDPRTLDGLPAPAARWLRHALPDGTPVFRAVKVVMSGSIKLGSRWMPFTADQILRAGVGFVWRPVVGGRFLRFIGADVFGPDEARMEFRLQGLITVAKASGPDVARSAAGRLAAETVAWLPQATTPQAGARWREVDDDRAVVSLDIAGEAVDVEVTVDSTGCLRAVQLQRWSNDVEPPGFEPFGADVSEEFCTDVGVRLAGSGLVGWGHGTPEWPSGQFFRFTIEGAEPIKPR